MKRLKYPGGRTLTCLGFIGALLAAALASSMPTAEAAVFKCDGKVVTVDLNLGQKPTNGDDVIRGTDKQDVISAGGGNDTICAGGGRDYVYGQGGNDRIFGNTGRDVLFGGPGNDVLSGQKSDDRLVGGDGNDTLYGGAGNDLLEGGNGADRLYASDGDDVLRGDAGTDHAVGGPGSDDCIAETTSQCEAQQQPPAWVNGAEIDLVSMGLFDFTVAWGQTTGAPDALWITLVDSSGVRSNPEFVDPRRHSSWTIGSFNNFALDPAETYRVEIHVSNAAGSSGALTVENLSLVRFEGYGQLTDPTQAQAFSEHSLIHTSQHYTNAPCATMTSSFQLKHARLLDFDDIVRFEAQSQNCTDGAKITKNVPHISCVLSRGSATVDSDISRSPDLDAPNSQTAVNQFGCAMANSSSTTIGLSLTKSGAGITYETTDQVDIRAFLSIEHRIEQWGSGMCVTSTSQPVNGGNSGNGCGARLSPTG